MSVSEEPAMLVGKSPTWFQNGDWLGRALMLHHARESGAFANLDDNAYRLLKGTIKRQAQYCLIRNSCRQAVLARPTLSSWQLRHPQRMRRWLSREPVLLPQQSQHALWHLVGLGHHGSSGLLQNLGAREVGRLLRIVRVHDAASRCSGVL